jgi:hypothetical protein
MSNHFRLPNTRPQACRKALLRVMQATTGNTIPLPTSDLHRDFLTNQGLLNDITVGNNGIVDCGTTYGFHACPGQLRYYRQRFANLGPHRLWRGSVKVLRVALMPTLPRIGARA